MLENLLGFGRKWGALFLSLETLSCVPNQYLLSSSVRPIPINRPVDEYTPKKETEIKSERGMEISCTLALVSSSLAAVGLATYAFHPSEESQNIGLAIGGISALAVPGTVGWCLYSISQH